MDRMEVEFLVRREHTAICQFTDLNPELGKTSSASDQVYT